MQFTEYDPKYRTARAASKLFGKHHRYLLFMMLKPESDVELWRRTPIFQYFEEEFGVFIAPLKGVFVCLYKDLPTGQETTLEVMDFFGHVGKELSDDCVPESNDGSDAEDDEEDDEEQGGNGHDGGTGSKAVSSKGRSVLRPRPSPAPARVADNLFPTTQHPKRRRAASAVVGSRLKRQALCPPSPSPESSELESSDAEDSEPAGPPSPSPPPAQQRKEDARTVVSRRPLEQADNYWKCTLDGARCSYMVTNAKTRDGRHAVEEHYAWHGELMAEAMKTIDQEAQRNKAGTCHVPYLMQKIRMMSQHWEENKPPPLRGLGEE